MRAHSSVAGRDDPVGALSRSRGAAAADAGTPTTPPRARASSSEDDSIAPSVPSPSSAAAGLAAHVQSLGWDEQEFSDVSVTAFGETYALHRLVLSRSPYFRAPHARPWSDAASPRLTLTFDDAHIDRRAVEASLAFLYDKLPTLDAECAPRVLAAAAFLDLEDLCRHCADFIVADVREETFVAYQRFAESRPRRTRRTRPSRVLGVHVRAGKQRARLETPPAEPRDARQTVGKRRAVGAERVGEVRARQARLRGQKVAATETNTNAEAETKAVARGVEDDARSVVRGIVDDLLDEMDGSMTKDRTATTTRRFAEDETSRRTEASLAASTLARCVRYQHVRFEDLAVMSRELAGDERVFPFHDRDDRDERDDPTFSSSRSPIRAVLEGLWTQTLLRSHVSKMCEGEEEAARRVREDGGAEDGEGTSDGARGESPREEEPRFSSERAERRPRDACSVPSSPDGTELPFRFGVEIEDALSLADGQRDTAGGVLRGIAVEGERAGVQRRRSVREAHARSLPSQETRARERRREGSRGAREGRARGGRVRRVVHGGRSERDDRDASSRVRLCGFSRDGERALRTPGSVQARDRSTGRRLAGRSSHEASARAEGMGLANGADVRRSRRRVSPERRAPGRRVGAARVKNIEVVDES